MIKILDFYSASCAPCKVVKPILEQYENVEFLDVRENMKLASEYGVRRVPTLIFLKDGEEVNRTTGIISKQEIDKILESLS